MLKKLLILFVCIFISACASSPDQLTSTVVVASIETGTPSPTLTPPPTITPTLSPTATPLPTPLGGGTGVIIFTANHYSEQFPSEEDGIYTVQSDSTGLKQVLSRSQFETMTGEKFKYIDFLINADQYYVSADALYSFTNDWKLDSKIDLPKFLYFFGFSTDSKYILYYQTDGNLYTSSFDGQEIKKLLGNSEYFTGTSADGSIVYFYYGLDVYQKAINIDGSNKRNVELTSLKDYVPYEGIKTPLTSVRSVYIPTFDSYALSPDKQQVAFTWADLLFVTSTSDSDFTEIELITRLPGSDTTSEVHADALRWSPNQEGLAILLTRSNLSRAHFGSEIIYVNVADGKIEHLVSSEKSNYSLCGFSPDSNQIAINFYDETTKKDAIQLVQVGTWSPVNLVEFDRWIGCPIWQDTFKSN